MLGRIIKNDLKRNKVISIILVLFTALAVLLATSGIMMSVSLMKGLDFLMEKAKTPHYLQMHAGEINLERIEQFARRNEYVEDYQAVGFINADNARIQVGGTEFSDSVQDNGFCIQNEKFDFLLDTNMEVIRPKEGEVYIPVCYKEEKGIGIGDEAVIYDISLKVAGFVRDSQMNSSLASSKRFIVNEKDYEKLLPHGSMEYLIEFRLKDLKHIREFEKAYVEAGLEANGPAITLPQMKLINALSEGMVIVVIVMMSIFLMGIAFMCIRFTILTQLEEDNKEIGIMKALGMEEAEVKKLFYGKYILLSGMGCILGLAAGLPMRKIFMARIIAATGGSYHRIYEILCGMAGTGIILLFTSCFIMKTLAKIKKVSPAKALGGQEAESERKSKKKGESKFTLADNAFMGSNIFLGMKDMVNRKKTFASVFLIFVFAVFLAVVPANLLSTIENPAFMRYMGVGQCDMRIDLQQSEDMEEKAEKIKSMLEQDEEIADYTILKTGTYAICRDDGTSDYLKVETGDHTKFPIEYVDGQAPEGENEIALSVMNGEELEKKPGDTLNGWVVSGIYSDITNGGKTAKAAWTDAEAPVMWYVINMKLRPGTDVEEKVSEYQSVAEGIRVTKISEFVHQTLGSSIEGMQAAALTAWLVTMGITALTVALFLRLLIAKDAFSVAILKSMGFTQKDIRVQYGVRFGMVLIMGVIAGTVLANTLGKMLAGQVLAGMGVSGFQFFIDYKIAYGAIPLTLMVCVAGTLMVASGSIKHIKIENAIRE